MLLSDGQELCRGPLTNHELLGDSTGVAALEVNVGYNQEWLAFNRGDEASRPWCFDESHAMVAVLPAGVQLGPQSKLLPYEARFPPGLPRSWLIVIVMYSRLSPESI